MSRPRLLAIDGTPSGIGVTFVYSAEVVATTVSSHVDPVWLGRTDEMALSLSDRRFLLLSEQ
jgi:hypothetical protein